MKLIKAQRTDTEYTVTINEAERGLIAQALGTFNWIAYKPEQRQTISALHTFFGAIQEPA